MIDSPLETYWDGKLMHLGYRGIMAGDWFRLCGQSARGTLAMEKGAQCVGNAVPTCLSCIGLEHAER